MLEASFYMFLRGQTGEKGSFVCWLVPTLHFLRPFVDFLGMKLDELRGPDFTMRCFCNSVYRFTPVIGPVGVYASPGLGVDKILSFVYFPTGAICETGGGAICETGICSACTFSYLNYVVDMKVDDTIGWKGHFRRNRSTHETSSCEKWIEESRQFNQLTCTTG